MGKARNWTYDEVLTEWRFILATDASHPGKSFNYDPACFARYCDMQSRQMDRSGFPCHAMDVRRVMESAR